MQRKNRVPAAWLVTVLLAGFSSLAAAQIKTEVVSYSDNGVQMQGYVAHDTRVVGKRPGVIVVHEWWGHNDYVRERARKLAELGYVAFAVDMYGDGKTAEHPEDAGKFATAVRSNMPLAEARFKAALQALKQHPEVDPDSIAAIGYCFGGTIVLEMARRGVDIAGVASFHGNLGTSQAAQPGKVKAQVRVYNGADDPMVTAESIEQFKAEMDKAGVDYQLVNYPGAKHAFTNPGADALGQRFNLPLAYQRQADEKSWQALREFLEDLFN